MNAMTVAEAYNRLETKLSGAFSINFEVWNHRDIPAKSEWRVWDSDREKSFIANRLEDAVDACIGSIVTPTDFAAVDAALAAMP